MEQIVQIAMLPNSGASRCFFIRPEDSTDYQSLDINLTGLLFALVGAAQSQKDADINKIIVSKGSPDLAISGRYPASCCRCSCPRLLWPPQDRCLGELRGNQKEGGLVR